MRPTVASLTRLYPARWRDRYGDEFAAVLEERPLGPFDVADVLLGALDAHLHLRGLGAASQHGKGFAMSLRIGGYAAVFGGILTFVSLAGGQLLGQVLGEGFLAVALLGIFLATIALLVALVGLSAFQARLHPRLAWAAFIIPALGACMSLIGLVGMATNGDLRFIGGMSAWYVWSIGLVTMIAGSALFGLATWRTRALSRPAAASLMLAAVLVLPVVFGLDIFSFLPEALEPVIALVAVLGFVIGWTGLGVSALRIDSPRPAAMQGSA